MPNPYIVERGDTLSHLATSNNTDVDTLMRLNPDLTSPNKIYAGQTLQLPSTPPTTPQMQAPTKQMGYSAPTLADYSKAIQPYEGWNGTVYNDSKGKPTIGYGHLFTDDSQARFQAAGLKDMYIGAKAGTQSLDKKQGQALMEQDISLKVDLARRLVPRFDDLDRDTQLAIVGSVYRGGLSGSPKTLEHINAGRFTEAQSEFMDNDEARQSQKDGTGVYGRMLDYSKAFGNAHYRKPAVAKSSQYYSQPGPAAYASEMAKNL